MENEYQVLNSIGQKDNVTQRDIAKSTGISLGSVNVLIKRLVKKGLVKIEKLNPRTIRYILTSNGLKEKASRTYNYIVSSYNYINNINTSIISIVKKRIENENDVVYLFGDRDEIFNLIADKFNHNNISYKHIDNISEVERLLLENKNSTLKNHCVLVWHPEFSDILEKRNISSINLLEIL